MSPAPRYGPGVHWLWTLPLVTTLVSSYVLALGQRALRNEARLLADSAERLSPLAVSVNEAINRGREFGASVADATGRYTSHHG